MIDQAHKMPVENSVSRYLRDGRSPMPKDERTSRVMSGNRQSVCELVVQNLIVDITPIQPKTFLDLHPVAWRLYCVGPGPAVRSDM